MILEVLHAPSSLRISFRSRSSNLSAAAFSARRSVHVAMNLKQSASKASAEPAHDFLKFVNASPTPFHAVKALKDRFTAAGFKEIRERDDWAETCKPGGKYFLTRNASTIVSFAIGEKWKPGNPIAMIGAHTDSPCLRVKPVSKNTTDGYLQVGCECYGGGLWHTWFDRDLAVAGRAMVRTSDGGIQQRLVRIDRPILRIPTLAIHFDRQTDFSFSKESQLYPIAGLVEAELNRQGKPDEPEAKYAADEEDFTAIKHVSERHHPYLVELLAHEAKVAPSEVVDFEVVLYDTQKACLGGLNNELLFSPRLDNLEMTYCSAEALIESSQGEAALKDESSIRLIACFDNEEIGSLTAQGADSSVMPALIRRLSSLGPAKDDISAYLTAYDRTLASSFLVSADMAHAVHPNYAGKYEARHKPQMNKGTVLKINANARYTTNSPSIALMHQSAERAGVPLQLFVINNDSMCGGTIGPMLAAKLGTRAVDLGNPQLSMHSIRETGGVYDVDHAVKLFVSYFEHYTELEAKILVD